MSNQRITLALLALEPGQEPPTECPCCGAGAHYAHSGMLPKRHQLSFKCGAALDVPFGGPFARRPARGCPSPRPTAVLRALRESLTDEQRDLAPVYMGVGDPFNIGDNIGAAADALEGS